MERPQADRRSRRVRPVVAVGVLLAVAIGGFGPWRTPPDGGISDEVADQIARGMRAEENGDSEHDLERASVHYQRALKLSPDHPRASAHLALVEMRRGSEAASRDKIRFWVQVALAEAPNLWLAHLANGKLAYLDRDYFLATKSAQEALKLHWRDRRWHQPPKTFAGFLVALIDRQTGHDWINLPYTLDGYCRYEIDPSAPGLSAAVAKIEEGFTRAWKPWAQQRSLLAAASLLERAGSYEDALKTYKRVLDAAPGQFDANHQIGLILLKLGQNSGAASHLIGALGVRRDHRTANNLGMAYFNRARRGMTGWEKAVESFELAIELNPSYATPHLGLGDVYRYRPKPDEELAMNYYQRALDLWDQALGAGQGDARIRAQRALCAAKLGRYAEAIKQIEAVLRGETGGEYFTYAARIYALAGQADKLYSKTEEAIVSGQNRDVFRAYPAFDAYLKDEAFNRLLAEPTDGR